MKSTKQVIAAYTRPAPIIRSYHIVNANKMIRSVAVQQIQAERPQGWHRFINRVMAVR